MLMLLMKLLLVSLLSLANERLFFSFLILAVFLTMIPKRKNRPPAKAAARMQRKMMIPCWVPILLSLSFKVA